MKLDFNLVEQSKEWLSATVEAKLLNSCSSTKLAPTNALLMHKSAKLFPLLLLLTSLFLPMDFVYLLFAFLY
uniref:Uncharacterized protein n=1 Tax=Arundo donax TaxID=35708 RepID=A0A0A9EWP0_ARUDO